MTMSHQKSKKVEEGRGSILIIKDTLISFLLLASLVFVLGACSDSEVSSEKYSTCFELNEDKTQVISYLETAENGKACSKDVVIPNGVTNIAENAFKDQELTSVEIPESVTEIEAYAFVGNSFSSYVYIPNENANVDTSAFDSSIVVVVEGTESCFIRDANDSTTLTDYFCLATTVEIPDDVINIADSVFENKDLNSVTLPQNLTSIGNNAFKDNNLESLDIPNSVTDIGDSAFMGNSFSSYVYIPNENANVDTSAFDSSIVVVVEGTESCFVRDSNNTTTLVHYPCSASTVEIPSDITSIADEAFENKGLNSVTLSQNLTSIGNNAFKDNNLESLDIPNSVTDIGDSAFAGNSNLELYIFPSSSNPTVGNNAFPNGYAIITKDVCFEFDATDTGKINDYYDNEDDNTSNPACPKDVAIPQGVTSFGYQAFYDNSLTSIIIPDSVTSIESYAFSKNSLTSVEIPDSVTSISDYTFSKNSLTSVKIPDSVNSIGNYAFYDNSLTSVEIPDSVTSIGDYAFRGNSLTSVEISNSINSISEGTFHDNALTSVEIPDSVNSIGSYAFSESSLTSVEIPDSVTSIGDYAFYDNSLTSVIIGSGVTSIETQAFKGNESSMTVCIEAQQLNVTLGLYVFDSEITPTYETDGDCFN